MEETKAQKVTTKEGIKAVTDNDFITAGGLTRLSLKARKLLYLAISQCRISDKEFYYYEISVKDFAALMGVTADAVYKEGDNITDELMSGFLRVRVNQGNKNYRKYSLFSTCEYEHDGFLRFKLNPDMTKFLLGLKRNFTQLLLDDCMRMRSPYSMAIWHLMQREMRSKKPYADKEIRFYLSLEELRRVTETEGKLKQISHFKERVLDKALKEIENNTGTVITYKNRKENRKIVGFDFLAVGTLHDFKPDPKTAARWQALKESFQGNSMIK